MGLRRAIVPLLLVLVGLLAPAVPTVSAASAATPLEPRGGQRITGEPRFAYTLTARSGRWSVTPDRIRYQWLRGTREIAGATGPRYRVRAGDVGSALRVRITARVAGQPAVTVVTDPTSRVRHRVDVRRTVRYEVRTRGRITASLREFRRQAQETFEDPRGWRGSGIRFVPVRDGGGFTLVLAEASRVPEFSPVCSATWSCRVGRYVVINQTRWKQASPAWNAAGLPLRGYRHMVVNHETGHWLGLGHASCPGRGRLAPVMMQQSKGTDGCRFNPWPTLREQVSRTPGA